MRARKRTHQIATAIQNHWFKITGRNIMSDRIDTIVIGGSAGSFTALRTLLADLPDDLPAAVLICQHFSSVGESHAVDLLRGYSSLPVSVAEDGMPIAPGQVVFARPDLHMMIGHTRASEPLG
jgi:chemotaxis response regulator CheB